MKDFHNSIFFLRLKNINEITQITKMYPILWNPPTLEYPPALQYLCHATMLSDHLKLLPSLLRMQLNLKVKETK